MRRRGNRDQLVIATKVAKLSTRRGLSSANIKVALDDSLRRLQTDHVDIYFAHEDDQTVPLEETLTAFAEMVEAGKVRYIAASQYSAPRLAEALRVSRELGVPGYIGLQTRYNLMDREFEGELQRVCLEHGIVCFPFYGLARGFLSGKYQEGAVVDSARAETVLSSYGNERGWTMVAVLGGIAARHGVPHGAVALEWLRRQPAVSAPLASARTPQQLGELVTAVELTDEDVQLLNAL
jgi:aryl-alcohol dehydrogenase-like predicted oxidoreductase